MFDLAEFRPILVSLGLILVCPMSSSFNFAFRGKQPPKPPRRRPRRVPWRFAMDFQLPYSRHGCLLWNSSLRNRRGEGYGGFRGGLQWISSCRTAATAVFSGIPAAGTAVGQYRGWFRGGSQSHADRSGSH